MIRIQFVGARAEFLYWVRSYVERLATVGIEALVDMPAVPPEGYALELHCRVLDGYNQAVFTFTSRPLARV